MLVLAIKSYIFVLDFEEKEVYFMEMKTGKIACLSIM